MKKTIINERIETLANIMANGSKKKFAELIGVSPQSVEQWINRGYQPSAEMLALFHQKINVNLHWLLCGIEPIFLPSHGPTQKPAIHLNPKSLKTAFFYQNTDPELRHLIDVIMKMRTVTDVIDEKIK